jgi:hypothetical protein
LLGEAAHHGRDKVTLVLSPRLAAFGAWAEQLVSESLGKDGRGILLIDGESLGAPEVYGRDRVFVSLELSGEGHAGDQLDRLVAAGHPVVRITVPDITDLGGEFFRWEFATAEAAAILGVDPFDQPNVQESKENTRRLMQEFRKSGKLPQPESAQVKGVKSFLEQAREFDYIAILAYVGRTAANQSALQSLRMKVRDRYRAATTLGFGPRFLHSTGQYHKGGPNNGLFLYLTADCPRDLEIPGEPYGFGVLEKAQALGDLEALRQLRRRVLHLHLGADAKAGIEEIAKSVS